MSTFLYSHLTSERTSAPPTSSFRAASPGEGPAAGKPGTGAFVDTLAALIPAEVLVAHGVLIGLGTKTETPADGDPITTITEPTALEVLFIALVITSLLLYVLPRLSKWDHWDFARMLIPPLAFAAWTILQKATMFDAFALGWSNIARTGVGIIAALILGSFAFALAYKADQKQPT
jgi:hypothetical protein